MASFKTVKYTKEFQYRGLSEWITSEAEINQGDDAKAVLHACKNLVEEFWIEISPEHNGSVVKRSQSPYDKMEEDFAFNDVKKKLEEIEFREDAQAYIETTEYRFTIEAKKIINSKPLKNK